jgi:Ig-like domain from next to BRCA1 gene
MKTSIWDILTGVVLLGILCTVGAFGSILLNPGVPWNPLPPRVAPTVPPLSIPTPTATVLGLPATWTPPPSDQSTPVTNVLPTLRPSWTPQPTNTPFLLPTFTPYKTTRSSSGGSGGSGSSSGVGGGSCQITYQNPPDNSVLPRDQSFDMHWTIKNTGSQDWRSDSVDVRFMSGDRVHTIADVTDMKVSVASGSSFDLLINMHTPNLPGTYQSNWALAAGNVPLCRFYVIFQIQ